MAGTDDDSKVLTFKPTATRPPVPVPAEVVYDGHRAYRAYTAWQSGLNWFQVAQQEGYPTAGAARYDVRKWLTEAEALVSDWSRREMLMLKVAQLEELRSCIWDKATGKEDPEKGPHLPSVVIARDLIMSEAKLLKLDETLDGDEEQGGPRTVVVQDNNYMTALEAVIASE